MRLDRAVEDHPSVVILLKEPHLRTTDESLQIVRRALGEKTDVELLGVLNGGNSHVLRDGKFFFAFHQAAQKYEIPGRETTELMQSGWDSHAAWMSFDLPMQSSAQLKGIDSLGAAYRVLLVFAFLCWSPNCLAVYFPAEGVTVPNLGDLADSIQWARRNGQNLGFLLMPKNAKE